MSLDTRRDHRILFVSEVYPFYFLRKDRASYLLMGDLVTDDGDSIFRTDSRRWRMGKCSEWDYRSCLPFCHFSCLQIWRFLRD